MTHLLQCLIWPAVAGNVAWAFISVSLTELPSSSTFARLGALFMFAFFQMVDWIHVEKLRQHGKALKSYLWAFDLPLAASVAVFAICTEKNNPESSVKTDICLTIYWIIGILGHLCGAWEEQFPATASKRPRIDWQNRITLASFCGFGILVLWTHAFGFLDEKSLWNRAVAGFAVLILWVIKRRKEIFS